MGVPATAAYRRNIAALAEAQPGYAALVASAAIPGDVAPDIGRDGTPTFRRTEHNGHRVWFGGSSMPQVSASALFARFHYDGSNVLLPGVLTGWEIRVITGRLPPFAALFVIEKDLAAVRLAMHLYDYTDLITTKRLVFLRGDDVAADLRQWFDAHPGFEMPKQLLNVPPALAGDLNALQRSLEQAGAEVVRHQAGLVASAVQRLRSRPDSPRPVRPRVAVLSIDQRPVTFEQIRRTKRALDQLAWPGEVGILDSPDHVHVLARLQAIERADADWVLLINSGPGHLTELLPEALPVALWILADSAIERSRSNARARCLALFAASRTLADTIGKTALPVDRIELCAPAADVLLCGPDGDSHSPPPAGREIVVLQDLPDNRPETVKLTLPSHRTLWAAMQSVTRAKADQYADDQAGEFLEEAQQQSGTVLEDAEIRAQFQELLRSRIAPAAVGYAAFETTLAADGNVAVFGRNWAQIPSAENVWRGSVPLGESLGHLLAGSAGIVLPCMSAYAVQTALDALAVGTPVICRATASWLIREYPGLEDICPHLCFFQTGRDLSAHVRQLRQCPEDLVERVSVARTLVRDRHTVGNRLTAMAERLCIR